MRLPTLRSQEDLCALVNELGFLPFFKCGIEGFSIAECCPPELWFKDDVDGPWEWKGPVINAIGCAYGKFIRNKTCYISREWFPDFANIRRDGWDYEGRLAEGLARYSDRRIMEVLDEHKSLLSRDLRALACPNEDSRKNFDARLTRLQMETFITTVDFEYGIDAYGKPFGWGIARYATPEAAFGEEFVEVAYARTPEESRKRVAAHLHSVLPDATDAEIERFIG